MFLEAFKNPPQTREEGLYYDDKQYKCVRADKNSIYAKYVSSGFSILLYKYLTLVPSCFVFHVRESSFHSFLLNLSVEKHIFKKYNAVMFK